MSINNIPKQGSIGNTGSINNIKGGGSISGLSHQSKQQSSSPKFEGNPFSNTKSNLMEIGAGITTLIGGILGYDKEASDALTKQAITLIDNPGQGLKDFGDAILSTYNLTVDDIGSMPLGDMVGNVLTGAWKHPIDTFLDVATLGQLSGANKALKALKGKGKQVAAHDNLVRQAEAVTKENIKIGTLGQDFMRDIEGISKKYTPNQISKGMKAIETIGFKNAPKDLINVMSDLSKANDTYKAFTSASGAKMINDVEFATRELISKQYGVTFEDAGKINKNSKLFKETEQYVIDNDVRPLFHLKPDTKAKITLDPNAEPIYSSLFERKFGTIDYNTAGKNLINKAAEFVDKVDKTAISKSTARINDKIEKVNKLNGTDFPKLNLDKSVFNNKLLTELNNELKKTMLSSGTYLGANIITTTLSILNNFDLKALSKTFQKLPKYRKVELLEAESPGLKLISRMNNKLYGPIAGVDRLLEQVATRYINEIGVDKYKLLQSTIPSRTAITNPILNAVKQLVPFGQYPAAAAQELGTYIIEKPLKTNIYNQIQKEGRQLNQQVQEQQGIPYNPQQALRNVDSETIQRSTVVTPIQALNMFMFGQQGDAIQIPVLNFINKVIEGKGDPHIFEVEGKQYRIDDKGNITTDHGSTSILPAITYAGRNLLGPVNFYNQVLAPMMSDKIVKDDTRLFNRMVNDTQYASMNASAKMKVTDKAREKLIKKVAGTYEYRFYDDSKISKRVKQKVRRKYQTQQSINKSLK